MRLKNYFLNFFLPTQIVKNPHQGIFFFSKVRPNIKFYSTFEKTENFHTKNNISD